MMWRFARGWSDSKNPLDEIRRAGELAREPLGDPGGRRCCGWGHISLAYANLVERKYDEAVAEAAIALAADDGRIDYYLVKIPIVAGQPELALEWIERAEAFYHLNDPRQQELASMKAYALLIASGRAAAVEVLDTIRFSDALVLRTTYLVRTLVLVMLDRLDEAKLEMRKLREHDPTWTQAKHCRRFFYGDPEPSEF
jgi:tetratricopeptide (TPR) repeat protein